MTKEPFGNARRICAVIQFQKKGSAPSRLPSSISRLGYCAFMIHDKDVDDNGELKGLHAHLVIEAEHPCGKSTWINTLAVLFDVETDAISVEVCFSISLSLQYLIHMNDLNKYQYSIESIQTNDLKWFNSNFYTNAKMTMGDIAEMSLEELCIKVRGYSPIAAKNYINAWKLYKDARGESSRADEKTLRLESENSHLTTYATMALKRCSGMIDGVSAETDYKTLLRALTDVENLLKDALHITKVRSTDAERKLDSLALDSKAPF